MVMSLLFTITTLYYTFMFFYLKLNYNFSGEYDNSYRRYGLPSPARLPMPPRFLQNRISHQQNHQVPVYPNLKEHDNSYQRYQLPSPVELQMPHGPQKLIASQQDEEPVLPRLKVKSIESLRRPTPEVRPALKELNYDAIYKRRMIQLKEKQLIPEEQRGPVMKRTLAPKDISLQVLNWSKDSNKRTIF